MTRERELEIRLTARRIGHKASGAEWILTLTEEDVEVAADELQMAVEDLAHYAGVHGGLISRKEALETL